MALTDGDKAECKEIAREIIKEVLAAHVEACPWGQTISKGKAMLVGISVGIGAVGAGTGIGFFAIIQKLAEIAK